MSILTRSKRKDYVLKKIEGLTIEEKKNLIMVLEMATPQTITRIKDIRQIDKICTIIENSPDTVELEDADHEFLKKRVNDLTAWMPKDRKAIISLADKIGI